MRSNKKLVYLSIFLIIILFLINGCKEYKGRFISSEDSSYGGCKENWQCSEWGSCINDQQGRTCNDLNDCGTTSNKPIEVQICESEEYYLRIGESINIDDKTVKLIAVGSDGSIIIDVNDMQKIINLYGIKTINGVDVYNAETFYANNRSERAAIIHAKKSIISDSSNQSDIYNLNLKIGETIKFLNGEYNITLKEVFKDGDIILEVNQKNFRLSIGQNVTMDILVIVLLNSSYEKEIARLEILVDIYDFPEYYMLDIYNFESTPANPKVGESVLIYFEDKVITNKNPFEFPKKIKISIYYRDLLDEFMVLEELIKEIYFPCSPYPEVASDRCLIEFNYQFLKEGVYKFLIQNFDENNKELETYFQEQYVFVINEDKIKTHKFPIGLWTYAGGNLDIVQSRQFNQIKDLSIDTIVDGNLYDLKFNKRLLFHAQKNGINVMFSADKELAYFSYNLDDDSEKERAIAILYLKELIKNIELEYKGFNSIYRYYLDDEPENELQINFVGDAINELNNINTPRKGTTTLDGNLNLIDYYYKNVNSKEVMVDHYPLFSDTPKEGLELQTRFDELTYILNHLNKLSKVYNKPFWFFVQAHQWGLQSDKDYMRVRDPTPKEIRAITYLALSYGAKGIFYFYYWSDPSVGSRGLVEENLQPNEKYYEVRKINQELSKTRDILIDLDNINTCNSKNLGINGNNLINNNWQFEDNGWSYTYSLNQNNEVNVYFNGNDLETVKNREDIWFDFWYDTNISTVLDRYIVIDYEIIKNSNNLKLYFNPAREDGSLKDIFLKSYLGKHEFIINLKNLRGYSESDIINTVAFFITNFDNGGGDLEVKINSIKDYKCELPYVLEATGNIEIGNFIHKNGDKYIILVNRDTNNNVRTKIKLNDNLGRVYIYDVLTKEEIYNEKNNLYTFYYNLGPGDGKLIKIVELLEI